MTADPTDYRDIPGMPEELVTLIQQELAVGNEIVEIGHSSPAPPVGAYVKLSKFVTTRPRRTGGGLHFFERARSDYSGEFHDEKRYFFVLEPPHPDVGMYPTYPPTDREVDNANKNPTPHTPAPAKAAPEPTQPLGVLERFRRSMRRDFESWHDGIGYNISLIASANPQEFAALESFLTSRSVEDWRDIEALAALDTPKAHSLLRHTYENGGAVLAEAVTQYAPHIVSTQERIDALVPLLLHNDFYDGLTQALLEVEDFHPPAIHDALWHGVLHRSGEVACHFAAMLTYLHGQANDPFDYEKRQEFLTYNTDDPTERKRLWLALQAKLGVSLADDQAPTTFPNRKR